MWIGCSLSCENFPHECCRCDDAPSEEYSIPFPLPLYQLSSLHLCPCQNMYPSSKCWNFDSGLCSNLSQRDLIVHQIKSTDALLLISLTHLKNLICFCCASEIISRKELSHVFFELAFFSIPHIFQQKFFHFCIYCALLELFCERLTPA